MTPENGVTVRLTGSVPLADEEFATVADGAALNAVVTILVVLLVLWLALKQARIILAVLVNLAVGLVLTAAVGLSMVGALNLISVAFAVLFVGLGVDFGIQFSVRFRAERYADSDLFAALQATARGVAGPLLLAAASIAAAFYSFLPTAYVGLSELGLIAGTGMIIALATTVTLLPALIAALKPAGEKAPVGFAALAPLDHFLERRRNWIVGATLTAVILGLPLLKDLRFDFNPLNLRSKQVESVATLLDLMRDPDTTPNTIDILESDLPHAAALAERLDALPEVAHVRTIESFIPKDQDEKLALIDDASFFFQNTMTPDQVHPPPTPAETLDAIDTTAGDLSRAAQGVASPAAAEARRLAGLLTALAKAPSTAREDAERVLVTPLITTLAQVRDLLAAEPVTLDSLPAELKSAWIAPDGEVRVEVAPRGDANNNAVLRRFVDAVRKVAPQATGTPIFVVEAAATIVKAFLQAALWSLLSIALILFIVLRRWTDVLLTLVPLLVAIVVDARNLRGDRAAAELRQHHRAAASARRRRRVQDLLRHGVAGGGDELPAIEPDAGGSVQRLHDRDRLRLLVVFAPSRHVEHGPADGARARNDTRRGRTFSARPYRDAAENALRCLIRRLTSAERPGLLHNRNSRRRDGSANLHRGRV